MRSLRNCKSRQLKGIFLGAPTGKLRIKAQGLYTFVSKHSQTLLQVCFLHFYKKLMIRNSKTHQPFKTVYLRCQWLILHCPFLHFMMFLNETLPLVHVLRNLLIPDNATFSEWAYDHIFTMTKSFPKKQWAYHLHNHLGFHPGATQIAWLHFWKVCWLQHRVVEW